ncbi:Polycomb protein sop-2, partial [Quaeritorhiza haematococci]
QNLVTTLKLQNLPLTSLIFSGENQIVAAGHDCTPYLFALRGSQWELVQKLDEGKKKEVSGNTAFNKFRQMDSRAQASSGDIELPTVHQNTIT